MVCSRPFSVEEKVRELFGQLENDQANIFQVQFIVIQSIYDQRQLSTVLVNWSSINHKTRPLFYCFCLSKNIFGNLK